MGMRGGCWGGGEGGQGDTLNGCEGMVFRATLTAVCARDSLLTRQANIFGNEYICLKSAKSSRTEGM